MNVIGLSAFYHDAACCLLRDGVLIAAASEERFTRVKHDPRLPVNAFRFCLEKGGIDVTEIDAVAWYEKPIEKLSRQLWAGVPDSGTDLGWLDPGVPERAIRDRLGFHGQIISYPHHLSHAASAFFFSGFDEAAVLTVDGVGEWATTTYGKASDAGIDLFEEVRFPHSLGLLYATITAYLGFAVNDGEYKVMGLAPYGTTRLQDKIARLIKCGENGQYQLNMKYFDFVNGRRMFTHDLNDLLGEGPRQPGTSFTAFHKDVAHGLQKILEEILLEKSCYLQEQTGARDLCMAGGVALNCVANGRILRETPFERLFVQPAAGDAGTALGAASLAYRELSGDAAIQPMRHAYFGPSWNGDEIDVIVHASGLPFFDYRDNEKELLETVATRMEEGKIIGWFQGNMEWGPRALGARSILANPLLPEMRERLNGAVKKRESFRPFAPSVLADHAADHFDLNHASPYMLEVCQVTSPLDLPGITHVDGSARPQTVDPSIAPRFYGLIQAFYRQTNCPMLINTSFNVAGEPIVASPEDALFCFAAANLDCLVLGDFLLERDALPEGWVDRCLAWRRPIASPFARSKNAINENLYTFV